MAEGGSGMWGGLVQSVVGMVSGIYGASQAKKNKQQLAEMEKNRPVYTRPEEAQQYLELYKNQAGNRELPGQSQYEQNIQQATSSGVRNVQNLTESPTASLGNITEMYRQEMGAYNNLAVQQQQYYQQNQDRLGQALDQSAKYSDMEFEYNKNAPWTRAYETKANEFMSNRGLMQQGTSTFASGMANTNFNSLRSNNSNSNTNYGQMQNDYNASINSGQGYDYNNDNSRDKTIA